MQDNIHLLFPTSIYRSYNLLTEEENDKIYQHILKVKDSIDGMGMNSWYSGANSPQNSFNVGYKHKIFDFLLDRINTKVNEYAKFLNCDQHKIYLSEWWWNVYTNKNSQEFHHHLPSSFSGVYFCKIPEGSAPIVFHHPNFYYCTPQSIRNEYNSDSHSIEPVERSLLIFQASTVHMVPPGLNIDPRITISFNYKV